MRKGLLYPDIDLDKKVVEILVSGNWKDEILKEQDESYGNTPLHVACSLHSYSMTKLLLELVSQ